MSRLSNYQGFVIGLICAVIFSAVSVFAWTGPTASAPNNNVSAPINVGTTDQVKNGGIGVNSLAVFGNSLLQASSYLNWGTTAGSSGYGIRDNAGTLEFKNSGGTWQTLQTIINNYITLANGNGTPSMQVFTSSGTWTRPSGVTKIKVIVTGGGGGGGGGTPTYTTGGGGGAGGTAIEYIDVTNISSVTVTVGAGGAGQWSQGSTGGTSSFGSYLSATGGSGGKTENEPSDYYAGGAGGTGSNGDLNIEGGGGDIGSGDHIDGGAGGASFWGGGARGTAGYFTGVAGVTGAAYGSGGGGGGAYGATSYKGGAGKAGVVVVEEYR